MILIKPENKTVAHRQLLISKKLFLHGLEHSNEVGDLNKIIAVHNFHNAIEIALKAIVFACEIKTGVSQFNFEKLLEIIDDYKEFKDRNLKLPYRNDLSVLNKTRNLVQHNGIEPERSTMEKWRVISRNFLVSIFDEYFECSFDELSSITLINDARLRNILEIALTKLSEKNWFESAAMSRLAFSWASADILDSLPDERTDYHFDVPGNNNSRVRINLNEIGDRIRSVEQLVAITSSGVTLKDYKKLRTSAPVYQFLSDGSHRLYKHKEISEDQARWVHDFVVNTLVDWQLAGLVPSLPEGAIRLYENLC